MTYSRRQLEALGEPFGDSATQRKAGGRIYGGGGSSAPSNQNVTQTSIPEYAKPYVEKMLGKAEAVSNSPYQAYGGERQAGFTPMQNQAMQGLSNLAPAQQLGTGTQMAGLAGLGSLNAGNNYAAQATNPGAVGAYMSPYIDNALQPAMREAARQSDIQGQMNNAQAVQQGAFGGARTAIVEAERQRNLGTLQNDIYSKGMQSAFENAQKAQQFGATLGLQGYGQALQGANTMGQLGQTQFNQQKDALQGQLTAGGMQQQAEQKRLDQQYQDFLNQRGYTQQQLAFMSDMLRGLPLSQSTQQQYTAPPSMFSQMAGLGLAGYGMMKAEGGMIDEDEAAAKAPAGLAELAVHNVMKGQK